MTKLPDLVTVLVVQRDEQRHLPVQQALTAIERPRYTIHWVTSADAARAALDEHRHLVGQLGHARSGGSAADSSQ